MLAGSVEVAGDRITLRATEAGARLLLVGGEPLDGPRHLR